MRLLFVEEVRGSDNEDDADGGDPSEFLKPAPKSKKTAGDDDDDSDDSFWGNDSDSDSSSSDDDYDGDNIAHKFLKKLVTYSSLNHLNELNTLFISSLNVQNVRKSLNMCISTPYCHHQITRT